MLYKILCICFGVVLALITIKLEKQLKIKSGSFLSWLMLLSTLAVCYLFFELLGIS